MKKFHLFLISLLSLLVFSCQWGDDGFYSNIENEVKIANAPIINVYVRYAMTRQGKTDPDGYASFKVGIPQSVSATTEPEYGFVRWAAFTTDFIATGDNQSKNKDIYFINDEDYGERILPNELSSDEVSFDNPRSATAVVTINTQRNDICLIPIIAQRPTVALSIPANGSSNVVKNMAVRVSFSKPMNPESFKNADGVFDKITISQGIQTFTSSGDIELNSEDITDSFELNDSMFSENRKMITLKFNSDAIAEGYASQSSVIITISKDVTDIYGFKMADDNKINFSVGSKKDSLAPRISWLSAGPGSRIYAFPGVYKDEGTITSVGSMTKMTHEGASLAPSDNVDSNFYDTYVSNRLGGDATIVMRVFAEDLAGSGSGQSHDGIEADVTMIAIRAKHLYNADGTPDAEQQSIDMEYKVYVPLQNNSSLTGSYKEIVNSANASLPSGTAVYESSYGALFDYDLSELPDGLIQIDVAAVDVVQNNGFYDGGSCSSEYGNGYASIFIVKDTRAPDAEANKDKVHADVNIVPNGRGFFNANYYNQLAVNIDSSVQDSAGSRLGTPSNQLKWIVSTDAGTNWASSVSQSDSRWRSVTSSYPLSSASLPSSDGPVTFSYALMDDLGNISNAVSFNSVTYDNTAPTVGTLGISADEGYTVTSITGNVLEHQTISIPVTDATAGLEKLNVNISCVEVNGSATTGADYNTPFASSSFELLVDGSPVQYNTNGTSIVFTNLITGSHTITLKGLQIADSANVQDDAKYRITVLATDAALNTSAPQIRDIGSDTTAPVINKIRVGNINRAIYSGATEYWSTEPAALTTLYVTLTETNSGAMKFDFTGSSVTLRSDSVLSWQGTNLPITIDSTGKLLTISNEANAIITPATGGEVIISNVILTDVNTVALKVSDLVTNTSTQVTSFTLSDNTTIPSFRYDANLPAITSVTLTDQGAGAAFTADAGYTDSLYVNATLAVTASDSGIYQISVTGANFDDTTLVNNASASDASAGFVITGANTITLMTNSNAANRILKGTSNIEITNVKLSGNDGDKSVIFAVVSLGNKASPISTGSIRLDTTAPMWLGDGVFVSTNADSSVIYPHASTCLSGNVNIGGSTYFYTQNSINIGADIIELNRHNNTADFYIDNAGPVSVFTNVTPGAHTIYAVDRAGNKSAEKTFYVVGDTSAPAAFDGYVTFTMPADGNIYRGNAATGTTSNYVIKQSANAYQIPVKLTGVTAADKDVHGVNRTALSTYAELSAQTDKSPIEYYAYSTDGTKPWTAIGTGDFAITLPASGSSTPYTIWLKDGCGNETSYVVPVNWSIDGSITSVTSSNLNLNTSSLVLNSSVGESYYRGSAGSTPTLTVTGFNDSCHFANTDTSDGQYTLRSRLLVITAGQNTDDLSTIPSNQFTEWTLYKSTGSSSNFTMTNRYPAYNTNTAYKLYIIIEDTLGNRSITQLKNGTAEKWLWDNDAPVAAVDTSTIQKVNTVDNKNYYSAGSSVKYSVSDPKSGIRNAGGGTSDYANASIPKLLTDKVYSLSTGIPDSNEQLTISGMRDVAGNISDAQGLVISNNGTAVSHWVKQITPELNAPVITGKDATTGTSYSRSISNSTNGANTFKDTIDDVTYASTGVLHTITASRSVTGIKVHLNVTTKKIIADPASSDPNNPDPYEVTDSTPLLGWIVRTSPLASIPDFVAAGDTQVTVIDNNDVIFEKDNTSQTWRDTYSGKRYYYAVNRAGLVSPTAVIIEFEANPIPALSGNFTYSNVNSFSNINFLKADSTIGFTTNTALTSANNPAELYKGGSTTPDIVVTYSATALTPTSYSIGNTFLSSLNEQSLKIKLFTDTEASDLIDITGPAANNSWIYDAATPVINRIEVEGLTRGTEDAGSTFEYWATSSTNKADVIITLTEARSGVNEFNFAGSSVSLSSTTALYDVTSGGTGTLISNYSVDTTNKKITISTFADAIKGSSKKIKVTDVQLLSTTTTQNANTISLKLKDVAQNEPATATSTIKFDSTVNTTSFMYDPNAPTVNSFTLVDQGAGLELEAESGFTNSVLVNASVSITASASGVAKLTVSGASFNTTGSNATIITVSGTEMPYTTSDGTTITFSSNKIIKGNFTAQITNLLLPTGDGLKDVSISATSLGNKTSTASQTSITLDTVAPVWVDDGVYVSTNNTDTTKIYPHSSTASSGNIKHGFNNDIYFYTKDTINIAASVTETNRKAGNADLYVGNSTTPVAELIALDPSSTAYTIYCADKAGNRSANKSFYVIEDSTVPEDISNHVTFSMPSGGNVFRERTDSTYVIKGNTSDPYKIIIKLKGDTSGNTKIDGTTYSSATATYDSYDFLTANCSPVEYYKITGDSVTGSGTVNTDWVAIPAPSSTADGLITIELPQTRNCAALSITLKDGCGNEETYALGGVSWELDTTIGTVTPTYENVVTNNSVNYHRNIASVHLACPNDTCFYDSYGVGNASEFTLRGCLVALPETATEPNWNTVDLTNLDSSWSKSSWYHYKTVQSTTAINMPFTTLPALTSSYKLFYVVEDKVGNRTAGQITSNLWMADNTAPSISDISLSNVRIEGSNYYFSDTSSVTYTVTDTTAGITKSDSTVGSSESRTALLKDILDSGIPTISGVADIVGNTITAISLPQGETGITWTRYTSAPDSTKTGVNVTNGSGTADGIVSSATSETITAKRSINSIKVSLTYTGTDELLGWVKSSTELTSFNDFYSTVDIAAGGYDNFTKEDTTTSWSNAPVYYYAVNKAGLICHTPKTVSFASNPIPAISGDITWDSITGYGAGTTDAMNYTKTTSAIKFATSNDPTHYQIIDGSGADVVAKTTLPADFATNGIQLGTLTTLANTELKLQLFTASEDSDLISLTGPAGINKWTYDATAPEFTMAVSDSVVVSSVKYVTGDAAVLTFTGESSDIMRYEYKASAATEAWSDTPSELTSPYQLAVTEGTSTIYTIRAIDRAGNYSTNAEVTLQKDATAPTGTIEYAMSGAATVTAADSSTGATGDYVATAVTDDTTGITTTTIVFDSTKVNGITFTPHSLADSGVGFVNESATDKGLYFKTGDTLGDSYPVADAKAYTIDGSTNVTYTIIVKDALGNSKTLGIFVIKAQTGAMVAEENELTESVAYSGLDLVPTYPKVEETDGSHNANATTNSGKWIKGFKPGSTNTNYLISTDNTSNAAYEKKGIANECKVVQYENGTPGNTITYATANSNWNAVYVKSDSIDFTLPVKLSSLPSNKLYYKVTYNNSAEPTDGWTLAEVQGTGDVGYITNVPVVKASIEWGLTFIFVWYKDELGHICVHSLVHPTSTNVAWWTKDGLTIETETVGTETGVAKVPFTRSAAGDNSFFAGITDWFSKLARNDASEPLKTRSVDLLSPEPVFADKPVSAAKPSKKTSKKTTKKSSVKKSSINITPVAEVVEVAEPSVIKEITEVAEEVKSTVSAETAEVTAAPVDEVTAEVIAPAAEITAEPSVVTSEESGVNPKLLYAIFAVSLAAIVIGLVAIVKMFKKKNA